MSAFHQKPLLGQLINWAHPLARGLVGAWVMNEGSGSKVYDLSGNGHEGVFVGNPLWVPNGIDFTDDAINAGGSVFDSCTSELTIAFSVKYRTGGSVHGRFIDKYPAPSIYYHVNDARVRFYGTIGGNSWDNAWAGSLLTNGQNYNITTRLGSGFQELYIGGELADNALSGGPYSGAYSTGPGVNAYLGNCASDMTRNFNGIIYYTYIYNRALIPSEIAWLDREPYVMFEPYIDRAMLYVAAAGGVAPIRIFRTRRR